jgi:hypothetical protein
MCPFSRAMRIVRTPRRVLNPSLELPVDPAHPHDCWRDQLSQQTGETSGKRTLTVAERRNFVFGAEPARAASILAYMTSTNEPAARCPVCGGPAKDVEISVGLGDGAAEPITIRACRDAACDAYYPMARQNT